MELPLSLNCDESMLDRRLRRIAGRWLERARGLQGVKTKTTFWDDGLNSARIRVGLVESEVFPPISALKNEKDTKYGPVLTAGASDHEFQDSTKGFVALFIRTL